MMRLICANDLAGYLARWAVQLHPFHRPEGLFEIVGELLRLARRDFREGVDGLPMHWFHSSNALRAWLEPLLFSHPCALTWNRPRSGHARNVIVNRFGGPRPEDDFIDLDALLMNIAQSAWRDAQEFEKAGHG